MALNRKQKSRSSDKVNLCLTPVGFLPADWVCLSVWGALEKRVKVPQVFGSTEQSSRLTVVPERLKSCLQETVQGCVHSELPKSGTAQATSRGLQTLAFP